jgi:hypothetical protein
MKREAAPEHLAGVVRRFLAALEELVQTYQGPAGRLGDVGIPPLRGALIRRGGFIELALSLEQRPEIKAGVGAAALIGSAVGSLRAGQLAAFFEDYAEVAGRAGVAALVRTDESSARLFETSLPMQLQAELEFLGGVRRPAYVVLRWPKPAPFPP